MIGYRYRRANRLAAARGVVITAQQEPILLTKGILTGCKSSRLQCLDPVPEADQTGAKWCAR